MDAVVYASIHNRIYAGRDAEEGEIALLVSNNLFAKRCVNRIEGVAQIQRLVGKGSAVDNRSTRQGGSSTDIENANRIFLAP